MATPGADEPFTLWGLPHSLYVGKLRSYLIKKGLPFRELGPALPRFHDVVVPAVRHIVVPVLETPTGDILQDTTEIIEFFEARFPQPLMIPPTPVQRSVAWLIDAYGSQALLPAAMHYRWSYRAEQEYFLRAEFGRGVYLGPDRDERQAAGAQLMKYFNGMLPGLGINPDTTAGIERRYLELLDALDIHLQSYPYLLGGRPSIADTGLMAPLFAHLARDPVPATLMKNRAPNVYRWTERMNTPAIADGEFPDFPESYFVGDAIAPTLEPVLRLIFRDWSPELLANAACYNSWVAANPGMPAGELVSATGERRVYPALGTIEYTVCGCRIQRDSMPHSLWHFQRVLAQADALGGEARDRFAKLVSELGGEEMMAMTLRRPLQRRDYVLVLGD